MIIEKFISDLNLLKSKSEALDYIYFELDKELSNANYDMVNTLLADPRLLDYSTSIKLGFLSITNTWKTNLPGRNQLFPSVQHELESTYGELIGSVLNDLR